MSDFTNWLFGLVEGFAKAGNWLITPIWNNLAPIALLGFGGLTVFLGVAIAKWLIS